MILHVYFLDELRVRAIVDNLRLAQPLPLSIDHLEEDDEGVRLRAVLVQVHVWQILATKAQLEP